MRLLPREQDKLLLATLGTLSQRRLARGLPLSRPEATALIAFQLQEIIRDGTLTVSTLMQLGKEMLGRRHVMPGVAELLHDVQVEGTFPDGTFLVTVHDPICSDDGNLENALYGSFLPIPGNEKFPLQKELESEEVPGAVVCLKGRENKIALNKGRRRWEVVVTNEGDRPIQVGSHFPLLETNPSLHLPRILSFRHALRLDIPAGTAVRFEPGERKTVRVVEAGGKKRFVGGSGVGEGARKVVAAGGEGEEAGRKGEEEVKRLLDIGGFRYSDSVGQGEKEGEKEGLWKEVTTPKEVDREVYASMFGPTTGDRVRLADSNLWITVERDETVYGDECKFGGGKTLRDGMGQASNRSDAEVLDLVITNALIVDWSGIYKADIGVKNGLIVGIGKAGNPDIMDGVTPNMIVGSSTEVIAGEKTIVTAGAIDAHVHYICTDLWKEALASGITTLIGGGTGPSAGTCATTCTSSKFYMQTMMTATDGLPLNLAFTGKGNDSGEELTALKDIVEAGAAGLKLHEDWGTTPEAIDRALQVGDMYDVQVNIHTDTLNESGFVESTIAAFKGRTIHTYHTEGAGGGHAPDIIVVCEHPNVLPSSTNPTRPYARNTLDEHLDMLMVCHHLDKSIPEDIAFADSRIRAETVAAEDVLQDTGAISMISSDSQAMGRIGEVVARTWRTAAKMREVRGLQEGDSEGSDNNRVKRYIAKYTINPAICHGMSHLVGQVAVGCLADLVVWKPENFGTKPDMVIKGGVIAWAQMGDANASIPTVQPVYGRPMWGAQPSAAGLNSVVFCSQVSIDNGTMASYKLAKRAVAVKKCRDISKRDMKHNNAMPKMSVDPETYEVRADGELCDCPPATELPMTKTHFIF